MMLLSLSLALLVLVLLGYPLWCLRQSRHAPQTIPAPTSWPSLSVLIVVRNGADRIDAKLANTFGLHYPGPTPQVLVYDDGSSDDTAERVARWPAATLLRSTEHHGKIAGLNALAEQASGEVLVFSDVDALLDDNALCALIPPLCQPGIGGVCGQRRVQGSSALAQAQSDYIDWDSRIKLGESARGSLTSNDGKLYALWRRLYQPIPAAVTDDLYAALSVIAQRQRFVFAPGAIARVPLPVHRMAQEIPRRRRIVGASLNGLRHHRRLLNPWRYGQVATGLWINKVGRRLLPLALLGLLLGSALLAPTHPIAALLLVLQLAGYGLAALHPWLRPRALQRVAERATYFILANIGMLLGWLDFITGRAAPKWEPEKGSAHTAKENDQ
ncbi:glycosyltransferase [Ferrimonas balearica]|uniref:glycosyltransferase n=1 Tax=Ferrimonas balearica TaxID=44012 RepID=UPI001C9391BD|nr:glycosyltransferase [Ferrimonas balearica]MBY5981975.1 glycosyltransferase [Ferrimonas balearica]